MEINLSVKNSSENIPVQKIFCLAKNYAKHIEEMASEKPNQPTIFMKPRTAIIKNGETIYIPKDSHNVHYEVELVVVIGKEGKKVKQEEAANYIYGYAVGLDVTLRDIQQQAIKYGHPWSIAKGFDTSAPISEILPREKVVDPHQLNLRLWLNGELRQDGNTKDMIFRINEIIAYLSRFFTLERGDLIYTGTPSGVGQIKSGDTIKAELDGLLTLNLGVDEAN